MNNENEAVAAPTAGTSAVGRNPLIFLFVTRLIDAIGFGIVMPVLPQLLLDMGEPDIAAATRTGGILLVTYAGLQFFFAPVMGNLSDRFGRRPVILASLFAYGVDYLLMGFAPSVLWLFVGRAVAGVAGAVYVPSNAFIADVTPPEKRAQAFGLMGSAFGLGFILGPGIGGLLGELGPRAPFFAAAALAGVNLMFGVFVLPESLPRERRRTFSWRRANPLGAVTMLQHYPGVLLYALAIVVHLIGHNVYPSTWAFFMTAKFTSSTGMIGATLMATGISMALAQAFVTGRLSKRVGEVRAAVFGLSVAVAVMVGYAFITDVWMVFPLTLIGALQSVAYPALNAMMSKSVPANAQGELQGGVASLSSIANVLGPLLMSQTLAFFTSTMTPVYFAGAAFILAAAMNLTAIGLLLTRRHSEQPGARSP
jgi:MFS transporter, DHA1 family, tetracycline resistance protein